MSMPITEGFTINVVKDKVGCVIWYTGLYVVSVGFFYRLKKNKMLKIRKFFFSFYLLVMIEDGRLSFFLGQTFNLLKNLNLFCRAQSTIICAFFVMDP